MNRWFTLYMSAELCRLIEIVMSHVRTFPGYQNSLPFFFIFLLFFFIKKKHNIPIKFTHGVILERDKDTFFIFVDQFKLIKLLCISWQNTALWFAGRCHSSCCHFHSQKRRVVNDQYTHHTCICVQFHKGTASLCVHR